MGSREADVSGILVAQLRELDATLRHAGIRYALIGGIAVNVHGYVRATRDLDIMITAEDGDALHESLIALGYRSIDRRPDIASYVRDAARLDILYARRPISRGLLDHRVQVDYLDIRVPAISVEGLIGLKVQAFNDDPRRIRDIGDLMELFKANRARLNMDEVRSYFALFDREDLLDEILQSIG